VTDPLVPVIAAVTAATVAILAGIAGESLVFGLAGLVAGGAMALAWLLRRRG